MCGICGILMLRHEPVPRDTLRHMNAAIRHRGPDDEGYYFQDPKVGLAMRRLSIIDRRGGHQPLSNEDETVWLTMNGEIYNHAVLRTQLQSQGHQFFTASDTEVIVHLYEEYGKKCVNFLRGMFAFALYDTRQHLLLLARDRSGQKPLYYAATQDQLIFASECKSLHASNLLDKQLDPVALDSYLTHGFVPATHTLFQGIQKLPAGYILSAQDGRIETEQYWDLPHHIDTTISVEEAAGRIREIIEESVRIRLMSEVPIGAFLSGGVDSSAVVGFMSQQLSSPVQTFSIGFNDQRIDEVDQAREVAQYFGTEHHEHTITGCSPELLRDINFYHDEPAADPAIVPTFLLSKFAKQSVTVALTGEGGDEIFGGYHHYKVYQQLLALEQRFTSARPAARLLAQLSRLPVRLVSRRLWKGIWIASLPPSERSRGWLSVFTDIEKQQLCRPEFQAELNGTLPHAAFASYQSGVSELDFLTQAMYIDSKLQLADQLLMKVDKASMAFSLEARCPLLDHQLIDYVGTLPASMKLSGSGSKLILKKALQDLLPEPILTRPKQGFEVPIGTWLRQDLAECAREVFCTSQSRLFDYVEPSFVQALWTDFSKHHDHQATRQLWLLLNLAIWCNGLDSPS